MLLSLMSLLSMFGEGGVVEPPIPIPIPIGGGDGGGVSFEGAGRQRIKDLNKEDEEIMLIIEAFTIGNS